MKKFVIFLSFILIVATLNAQDSLLQYTGKYVFPDGAPVPDVEVISASGALSMASVAGNSSLVNLGVDSFQIVEFSGTAVFKRGEDKMVNAVHIEAMGYVLDGKKESGGGWSWVRYYLPGKEMLLAKN